MPLAQEVPIPLKEDLLTGASEIADYIGKTERRVYYLCEHGHIPAFKVGIKWHSRKSALDRHYGGEI